MSSRIERGCFITLEGGEGTGKSTQTRLLAERLKQRGIEVIVTREPGGTPGAEAIRSLLVTGAVDRWQPITEALLHTAARVEHVTRSILPALERGIWVISDRHADSTRAYQGAAQGLGNDIIDDLTQLAIGDFAPDLTLVLDLPVDRALARAQARNAASSQDAGEDRYERMGTQFHETLRQAFLDIARKNADRCRLIDADGSQADVAARIWAAAASALAV